MDAEVLMYIITHMWRISVMHKTYSFLGTSAIICR